MKTPIVLIGAGLLICALAVPAHGQESPPTALQSKPMKMMEMRGPCEHCQVSAAAIDAIQKLIDEGSTSKDAAILRLTLDRIGVEVAKLRDAANKCEDMMGKMKKNASPTNPAGGHDHTPDAHH